MDAVLILAGGMEIPQVEAAGYIALVVSFAIEKAYDNGIVDHLTDKAIERACFWGGNKGELVQAFTEFGIFVGERDSDENPLRIEPGLWEALAGKVIKQRIDSRRRKEKQRSGTGKTTS